MTEVDPKTILAAMLTAMLQPWHDSVADPSMAQHTVLQRLLGDYSKTEYGKGHGAGNVDSIETYRDAFPIMTYAEYKPLIDRVMAGEIDLLLAEEPVGWAITRGTTESESKFIPMTPTDLEMRVSAGRAVMQYIVDHEYSGRTGARIRRQLRDLHKICIRQDTHPLGTHAGRDRCTRRWENQTGLGRSIRIGIRKVQRRKRCACRWGGNLSRDLWTLSAARP